MASRTVWIVGGLVVAIGAIAYLSHNKAPAGKDAAGTIVEAKRARAEKRFPARRSSSGGRCCRIIRTPSPRPRSPGSSC